MRDTYNREIEYLRVSLTELCNLRCRYCMPMDGVIKKEHSNILTMEELLNIIRVASKLGIKKIRLTGGEPLVKQNIVDIVYNIKQIDGIEEICLTTNGTYLKQYAKDLKSAGLDRINISLDTLDKEKFKYITRIGNLADTLNGIDFVLGLDFKKIKINMVVIGGFNDDEIINFTDITLHKPLDVRFIELMPMYDSGDFGKEAYISYNEIFNRVKKYYIDKYNNDDIIKEVKSDKKSVAKLYRIDGALANIGFISPVSNHFCSECNRLRLTADGKLKPCLHSSQEIPLKGLNDDAIEEKIKFAISSKPKQHNELSYKFRSEANRNMNEIGG